MRKTPDFRLIGKIVGWNLAVLLVQAAIFGAGTNEWLVAKEVGATVGLVMFYTIPAQLAVNLVLALLFFAKKDTVKGTGFMLSILVVFLVGYSVCGEGYEVFFKGFNT